MSKYILDRVFINNLSMVQRQKIIFPIKWDSWFRCNGNCLFKWSKRWLFWFLPGYKNFNQGRYGTAGVNAGAVRSDCASAEGNGVESVLELAQKAGKSVGIVTTTYITHASPSAAYARTVDRSWYSDGRMEYDGYGNVPCEGFQNIFRNHFLFFFI